MRLVFGVLTLALILDELRELESPKTWTGPAFEERRKM